MSRNGRIRTIKPEWRSDQRLMKAGHEARILSVVLITLADDEGRGRWIEPVMAAEAFGYDPEPLASLSRGLASLSGWFLSVYEVDGEGYFQVVKWSKHQRIDKPTPSRLPPPPSLQALENTTGRENSREPREEVASPPELSTPGPWTVDRGPGTVPPAEDFATSMESARSAFAQGFRSAGEKPPPWVNGYGTAPWQTLTRWLLSEHPQNIAVIAEALGRNFAKSAFAKGRGYREKILLDGPSEFLPAFETIATIPAREYDPRKHGDLSHAGAAYQARWNLFADVGPARYDDEIAKRRGAA